jgi:hypothetical protein
MHINTDVEAKVTDITENGVKVKANWPPAYFQFMQSPMIVGKLEPHEISGEAPAGDEQLILNGPIPNRHVLGLRIGDWVMVRLFC